MEAYDLLREERGAVSVTDIQTHLSKNGEWVYSPPTIRKVLRENNRKTAKKQKKSVRLESMVSEKSGKEQEFGERIKKRGALTKDEKTRIDRCHKVYLNNPGYIAEQLGIGHCRIYLIESYFRENNWQIKKEKIPRVGNIRTARSLGI